MPEQPHLHFVQFIQDVLRHDQTLDIGGRALAAVNIITFLKNTMGDNLDHITLLNCVADVLLDVSSAVAIKDSRIADLERARSPQSQLAPHAQRYGTPDSVDKLAHLLRQTAGLLGRRRSAPKAEWDQAIEMLESVATQLDNLSRTKKVITEDQD